MAAFLKNLFTPKWQHSDASVRIAAIDAQSDLEILKTLANKDTDLAVRLKAVSLLKDGGDLIDLASDKNAQVKEKAIAQYLLINLGSNELTEQKEKVAQINDSQLLMNIATLSDDKDLAQAAIAKVTDQQQLMDFITKTPSAKARQLAIENIFDEDKLKAIEQQYKNKDKTLTRIAKNKLAQSLKAEQQKQEHLKHTIGLLQQAITLSSASFKPTYLAELSHLKQVWLKANKSAEQENQFKESIKLCDEVLTQNQAQQAALVLQQENTLQAQQQQKESVEQLHEIFEQCKSGAIPQEADLLNFVTLAQEKWAQAETLQKANGSVQKEFNELLKPLAQLHTSLLAIKGQQDKSEKLAEDYQQLLKQQKNLQSTIKSINWPTEFPEGKEAHQLQSRLNQIKDAIEVHRKNEKQTIANIKSALETLEANINDGHIKNAKQLQSKARKLLKQIPTQNDKSLSHRFSSLTEQLDELKDWQGFATAPKMEQLCTEMAALISAQIDATQLAQKIHDLQEQWKSLGGLPDKQQHQALWVRFKTAADTAYEPCKQYYQDLSRIKQHNKEQKEEICQQLESFYEQNDWQNADWKAIQGLMNQVSLEYKKYTPVENSAHKTLQARFHQANKLIQDKISEFYQDNADQKQQKINSAKELFEQDDLNSAIESCKSLQQEWKTIGSAGRQEHSLWKTFREQCDALFNRRSEQNEAHKQQVSQEKNKAQSLLEEANVLAEKSDKESLSTLKTLKASLSELDLPQGFLEQKLQQIVRIEETIKNNQQKSAQQAKQQLWFSAIDLSDKLALWELNPEQDKATLETQIQEAKLPKGVLEVFNKRINDTQVCGDDDYLNLCLELEISLDVESPAGDQAARMALQVKRLQQNMGKKQPDAQEQLQTIKMNWFALRASTEQYSQYSSRFTSALNLVK